MASKTSVSPNELDARAFWTVGDSPHRITSGSPCPDGCEHAYRFVGSGIVGVHIPLGEPTCIAPKLLACSVGGGLLVLACESASPKQRKASKQFVAHDHYESSCSRSLDPFDATDRQLMRLTTGDVWVHGDDKSAAQVSYSTSPVCRPCAEKYRKRVQQVFRVPMALARPNCLIFLTVTAPGDGPHCKRPGCTRGGSCQHEKCRCAFDDGEGIPEWNADLGGRWNRFCQELYRFFERRGIEFEYGRAVEVQDGSRRDDGVGRLALHEHVAIITSRPVMVTAELKRELRKLAIKSGYGHNLDLQQAVTRGPDEVAVPGSRSANLLAWYLSKYVSDATGVRPDVPWKRRVVGTAAMPASPERVSVSRETGEIFAVTSPAVAGVDEVKGSARSYRTWTTSRAWGCSMGQVRQLQRAWWLDQLALAHSLEDQIAARALDDGCALGLDGCSGASPPP